MSEKVKGHVSPAHEGIDLADLLPAIADKKGLDIGEVVGIYMQHKSIIDRVLGVVFGLFKKKPKAPKVDPGPGSKPGVQEPQQPPQEQPRPVPVGARAVIAALRSKVGVIQQNAEDGRPYSKPDRDDIVSGAGKLNEGDRIHFDATPVDANGYELQPGDPAEAHPSKVDYLIGWNGEFVRGSVHDDVDDAWPGPLSVHSWHDDYGLTPVLKVHKTPDETGDAEVTFQMILPPQPITGGVEIAGPVHRFRVNT